MTYERLRFAWKCLSRLHYSICPLFTCMVITLGPVNYWAPYLTHHCVVLPVIKLTCCSIAIAERMLIFKSPRPWLYLPECDHSQIKTIIMHFSDPRRLYISVQSACNMITDLYNSLCFQQQIHVDWYMCPSSSDSFVSFPRSRRR